MPNLSPFLLLMLTVMGLSNCLYSSSMMKSGTGNTEALTRYQILSPREAENEKTSKAFKEIQEAFDQYKEKISKICPNSFDLLTDPRFLASTLPQLSYKFLVNPSNASLLNSFAFNIPFLRINDQPVQPEFSDTLFQLVQKMRIFIQIYDGQEKSLKFKESYNNITEKEKFFTHQEHLAKTLSVILIDILDHCEETINKTQRNNYALRFYSTDQERNHTQQAFNHVKSLLESLNGVLSWKVFDSLKGKSKIGDRLAELQAASIYPIGKFETEKADIKAANISQWKRPFFKKRTTASFLDMLKKAESFSKVLSPSPMQLANQLDREGHIIFKISAPNGSDSSIVTVHYFDSTVKAQFAEGLVAGYKDIKIPQDLVKFYEELRQDFEDLREEEGRLKIKRDTLVSTMSSPVFSKSPRKINVVQLPTSSENIYTQAQDFLQDTQSFLARQKNLEKKANLALALETFHDYDFKGIDEGLYVFLNPKTNFSTDFNIEKLVKSLQFSAGKSIRLHNKKTYAKQYYTWDKMPSRGRASIINKIGQAATHMFATKCMLQFAKNCWTNFEGFLHSLRYCSLKTIEPCLIDVRKNPAIQTILGNIYNYNKQELSISQVATKMKIIQSEADGLIEEYDRQKSVFLQDTQVQNNVVWFLVLVELLHRQFSNDMNTGFRNSDDRNRYLEKILIDAASIISNIKHNVGDVTLHFSALKKMNELMSLSQEKLEERKVALNESTEISEKMRLLKIASDTTRIGNMAQDYNDLAAGLDHLGSVVAGATANNAEVLTQSRMRDVSKKSGNIGVREEGQRFRQKMLLGGKPNDSLSLNRPEGEKKTKQKRKNSKFFQRKPNVEWSISNDE